MDEVKMATLELRIARLESARQRLLDSLPVIGVVAVMSGLYLFTWTQPMQIDERLGKIETRLGKIESVLDSIAKQIGVKDNG